MFGGDSEEVTPVPIPNTEVKLFSADGSRGFPPVRVGRRQASLNPAHRAGFFLYICTGLFSSVSILLSFLLFKFSNIFNTNTIPSMINMSVVNNQNAVCTGNSSRLHPTAIGRIEPPNPLAASSMLVVCSVFPGKID